MIRRRIRSLLPKKAFRTIFLDQTKPPIDRRFGLICDCTLGNTDFSQRPLNCTPMRYGQGLTMLSFRDTSFPEDCLEPDARNKQTIPQGSSNRN